MRVLIACEFSGIVRKAFQSRGHDAWSCDLLPAEDGSEFHFQHDCRGMYSGYGAGWDLMIAHPPCTYLCNSGVRWLYEGGIGGLRNEERWRKMVEAAEFFKALLNAPIARVCIENPVMHGYALKVVGVKHSQTIQPYEHGHGETKRTGLWLRGLPLLKPSDVVAGRTPRVHHASPGPDRWKERSRTLPGIAAAMAEQWGSL